LTLNSYNHEIASNSPPRFNKFIISINTWHLTLLWSILSSSWVEQYSQSIRKHSKFFGAEMHTKCANKNKNNKKLHTFFAKMMVWHFHPNCHFYIHLWWSHMDGIAILFLSLVSPHWIPKNHRIRLSLCILNCKPMHLTLIYSIIFSTELLNYRIIISSTSM
jgi:hypothetical protein